MKGIPRIRGRAGQAEAGQEHAGKWFYEIGIWDLSGETRYGDPIIIGPYDTEKEALEAGRGAVKIVCETAETMNGGKPSGKYLDLKAGAVMRPWEEM